jgi:hypothetical protein
MLRFATLRQFNVEFLDAVTWYSIWCPVWSTGSVSQNYFECTKLTWSVYLFCFGGHFMMPPISGKKKN